MYSTFSERFFKTLSGCGVSPLRRSKNTLIFEDFHRRERYHFGFTLYHWSLPLGRGRLIMRRGMCFDRFYLSRLGGCQLSQRREYSFYHYPPKNLLRCEIEKVSPMVSPWGSTRPFLLGIYENADCSPTERPLITIFSF